MDFFAIDPLYANHSYQIDRKLKTSPWTKHCHLNLGKYVAAKRNLSCIWKSSSLSHHNFTTIFICNVQKLYKKNHGYNFSVLQNKHSVCSIHHQNCAVQEISLHPSENEVLSKLVSLASQSKPGDVCIQLHIIISEGSEIYQRNTLKGLSYSWM